MLNAERRLSTATSTALSTSASAALAVDAPESTAISAAVSTAAGAGVISTADSTVKAAATTADTKAESASTRASSVSASAALAATSAQSSAASAQTTANSAASAAVVADSKAVSVGLTMQARNLGNKNVGSVQNSDAGLRISTAGDFSIGNVIYTKAASSAVFAFPASTLSSSQAIKLLATLNSAGTGTVTAGAFADSGATVLPATPAGGCPVAIIDIACGTSSIVLGTTTFSEITSSGGSTVITQVAGVN